jgi:hypothetical protein
MDGQQDLFAQSSQGHRSSMAQPFRQVRCKQECSGSRLGAGLILDEKMQPGLLAMDKIISTQSEYTSVPTSSNIFHSDTCSLNLFITSHSLYTYIIYYIQHIHVI